MPNVSGTKPPQHPKPASAPASGPTPAPTAPVTATATPGVWPKDSEFDGATGAAPAAGGAPPTKLEVSTRLPVEVLTQVGATAGGRAFLLDGGALDGMEVRVRQVVDKKQGAGTELSMRLNFNAAKALADKLKSPDFVGVTTGPFLVEKATFANGATQLDDQEPYTPSLADGTQVQANKIEEPGQYVIEYLPDSNASQAYRERLRVRVFGGTDDVRQKNFNAAVKRAGLGDFFVDADPKQIEKTRRLELLHTVAPHAEEELGTKIDALSVDDMTTALGTAGVTPARIAGASVKEVFPGHVTVVDPALGEAYQKAGVRAVMVGVNAVESVALILGSDGLMSTNERYGRGLHRPGASSSSDEKTGGSNYAFTRLLTSNALRNEQPISNSFSAGQVQLLTTGPQLSELLSRTDWHAYSADCFGTTVSKTDMANGLPAGGNQYSGNQQCSYSDRPVLGELVTAIATNGYNATPSPDTNFAFGNEAMFHSGVRASTFTNAVVQSEEQKTALIALLKDKGITKIGPNPIETAVIVAGTWKQAAPLLGLTP